MLAAFPAAQKAETSILPTAVPTSNVELQNRLLSNVTAFILPPD